jgi:RNase P/RNase MRP subunit POP5
MQAQDNHRAATMSPRHPNKSPMTSTLESPTSYLLCELTVDGRIAADCALCRDVIQSACRVCLGNIGAGLANMKVVKQCSSSVFIVSVASSHLSQVWAAITIISSFEKLGTSNLLLPSSPNAFVKFIV